MILLRLLRKFSQPENLRQLNKLARVVTRIILLMDYREGLQEVICAITDLSGESGNRTLLKALLKILAGVITDREFSSLLNSLQAFKHAKSIDKLKLNYTLSVTHPLVENEKLRDSIVAYTFRVLFNHFLMFYELPKMQLPDRPKQATERSRHEEKRSYLERTFELIRKNPRRMKLPKTLCTFLFTCFDLGRKHSKVGSPQELVQFVKSTNCLQILNQQERFDSDLFDQALKLFPWYDFDTKLLLLDFIKQMLDRKESRAQIKH